MKKYISLAPLILERNISHPVKWDMIFKNDFPLIVEIGFGDGKTLITNALKNPKKNFIGLEMDWLCVRRILKNIAQNNIKNVRIIKSDAKIVFDRFFDIGVISEVYALFPCPWPKTKSIKHRLFSQSFLKILNNRLVKNGTFFLETDSEPFHHWVHSQSYETGFKVARKTIPASTHTRYARKWFEEGVTSFFQLEMKKIRSLNIPAKEDKTLKTYTLKTFDPDKVKLIDLKGPETVIFKDFFYDPLRKTAMIHAVISEDNITQHSWISIREDKGLWKIKPTKGCAIIPTVGIQKALDQIAYSLKNKN